LSIVRIRNYDTGADARHLLEVIGESQVISGDHIFDGAAFSDHTGDAAVFGAPPFIGLAQHSETKGVAHAVGTAQAFLLTDGLLMFGNMSGTEGLRIDLEFVWSLRASASADDASSEDAFSSAFVQLATDFGGLFPTVAADALLGPASDDDSGQFTSEMVLGPRDLETVYLSTFADGFASAFQVPEASTLSLLFAAFLALENRRRRDPDRR
jgi:hypothetical protein